MDLDKLRPAQLGAHWPDRHQLWALIEESSDGVWLFKPNSRELYWSESLADLLGYDLANSDDIPDLIAMTHAEDRERHVQAVTRSRAAGDGSRYGIDVRLHRRDGSVVWLAAHGIWFGDEDAPDNALVGMVRDVSDRARALSQRDASEAWLSAFLERVPAACYIKDSSGRYVYGNRLIAEFLGTTPEQFVGASAADFFSQRVLNRIERADEEILKSGEAATWFGTFEPRNVDVRRRVWDTRFPLRTADGVPLLGGVTVDLTSVYANERELEIARRLETIGLMAGGIAHDFNNLIFAIAGNAELALEHVPDSEQSPIRAILAASEHAADLCRQLLTVGGQAGGAAEPVRIERIVRDSSELLAMVLQSEPSLDLRLGGSTARVRVDPGLVRQVLINLVINAKRASSPDSSITIACDDAPFEPRVPENGRLHSWLPTGVTDTVCLTVADSGSGIRPEHLDHIFEPYFSASEAGHGLGLASVLGAVKASDAAIRVISAPGNGTRFDIFFAVERRSAPPRPSRPKSDAELPVGQQRHVMVIDDNTDIVDIVVAWLARLGATADAFTSSVDAVEALQRSGDGYDIVMTDLSMPDISGLEVLARVRQTYPDKPVILASGYNDHAQATAADERVWFLQKPYTQGELRGVLQLIDSAIVRVAGDFSAD